MDVATVESAPAPSTGRRAAAAGALLALLAAAVLVVASLFTSPLRLFSDCCSSVSR